MQFWKAAFGNNYYFKTNNRHQLLRFVQYCILETEQDRHRNDMSVELALIGFSAMYCELTYYGCHKPKYEFLLF